MIKKKERTHALLWVYSNAKENHIENSIQIVTIDNPGWGVTIDLKSNFPNIKLPLADTMNNEDDWYYCTIKGEQFQGDGGLFNLIDILYVFKRIINCTNSNRKMRLDDNFVWLSHWFSSQCDGDWEHGNGIKIGTLDNPGWRLKVSILGTELENKEFERIAIERSENDWVFCFIEEGHFEGACGLYNLPEALKIFRNWAESTIVIPGLEYNDIHHRATRVRRKY